MKVHHRMFRCWLMRLLFLGSLPLSITCLSNAQVIRQTYVGYVSYNPYVQQAWEPIRIGDITIRISDEEDQIMVSGPDEQGRPWNAYIRTTGGVSYSLAWAADLNGDGTQALIFVHHQALNGRCVTRSRLNTILFDSDGRPSPWEIESHLREEPGGTEPGRGVLDLGDWNGNGRAELVHTGCYGYEYQALPYNLYAIEDVYEIQNGVWRKLTREERSAHETTYREIAAGGFRRLLPEREEMEVRRTRERFSPDYSNDRARGIRAKIAQFSPRAEGEARTTNNCGVLRDLVVVDGQFIEKSGQEKWITRQQCDQHLVLDVDGTVCFIREPGIVLERSDSTEIVLDWGSKHAQSLLDQIVSEQLPVTLTGQLEEDVCSPTLIWAAQP